MSLPQVSSIDAEYDIIFAGGGAAACVTAGRLATADASLKVLILEAGPPTKDLHIHTQPARYLSHLRPESTTVRFHVEPHVETLGGRPLIIPCGQCFGGGSSVNWTVYTRPSASDFDDWETKYKNPGWGSQDIIPLLQKTNPNLHVVTSAHVQHILFDANKRACGVQFKWNPKFLPGEDTEPRVSSVLRSLDINVVEELPGVGDNFQDHSIAFNCFLAAPEAETLDGIIRNNPDVVAATSKEWSENGTGLMATNGFDTLIKLRPNEKELEMLGPEFRKVWDAQFAHAPDKPVIFMGPMSSFIGDVTNVPDRKYFSSAFYLAYPVARGHVHVTSADDVAAPLDFKSGYFENIADIQPFILAYKIMREISRRNHFFRGEYAPTHPEFPPGSQAAVIQNGMPIPFDTPKIVYTKEDDKAIEMYMRKFIGTAWHALGTCAMKPREQGGVVDPRLNVYGVQGLKIADLSICPSNVAANTYSAAVAVGEKAAVIIAEDLGIKLIE
ncbi:hypothetical protein EWM64_g2125 [Hericium alpestre]|uniref:Glucose-methanol-choline oxidoreductase N-terminal domain-containing protein n=1 Tax=Hericium alpestre TaxID=135208 RepID=A0A4Z0A6A0_9AGAM|nr:hypothetical protein EWM64_g2125 [Hericium alpestre]